MTRPQLTDDREQITTLATWPELHAYAPTRQTLTNPGRRSV